MSTLISCAQNNAENSIPSAETISSPSSTASISQYGITWYFDKEYICGQFANGDWWVVGPVKIIAITPGSQVLSNGRIINGSMLNPAVDDLQGYDSVMFGLNNDINYNLLPALSPPASTPDITEVADRFEKPWIEHRIGWLKELFLPPDNMHMKMASLKAIFLPIIFILAK